MPVAASWHQPAAVSCRALSHVWTDRAPLCSTCGMVEELIRRVEIGRLRSRPRKSGLRPSFLAFEYDFGLGTRAFGPRSSSLTIEKDVACPPKCIRARTTTARTTTEALKQLPFTTNWSTAHTSWSTGAAAHTGQDDHCWKEGRTKEEAGTTQRKVSLLGTISTSEVGPSALLPRFWVSASELGPSALVPRL